MRNEVVHGAKLIPMSVSVSFLLNYADSLQLSQCKIVKEDMKGKKSILSESEQSRVDIEKRKARQLLERWKPPEQGCVKVNVDGAFNQETGRAGIGIIMRDSTGMVIICAWKAIFDGMNAEEVEALAWLEGVRLAAEWSQSKAIIESDCSTVVLAACRPGVDKS